MSKPTKSNILKKTLIQAMTDNMGIVTSACKQAGCDRSTYYEYYNHDPEFRKQIEDISEVALDFVESQLLKQIKEGNGAQTIFYLKTKGKHRGYVERQEITGKDGAAIELNSTKADYSKLSTEELEILLRLEKKASNE